MAWRRTLGGLGTVVAAAVTLGATVVLATRTLVTYRVRAAAVTLAIVAGVVLALSVVGAGRSGGRSNPYW